MVKSTLLLPVRRSAPAALMLCLAALLAACSSGSEVPSGVATQLARPTRTPLPTRVVAANSSIVADGVLALAGPTVSLSFETSGKVTAVRVTPGQSVKKGDVIATVDDTALRDAVTDAQLALRVVESTIRQQNAPPTQAELAAARAALSSANATYNVTKAGTGQSELEAARRNWEAAWLSYLIAQSDRDVHCGTILGLEAQDCKMREASYGNAYESMLAAKDSYEKAKEPVTKDTLTQAYSSVASAKAKLDALSVAVTDEDRALTELQLSQSRSALARAQEKLGEATLLSPCDCIVQEVNAAVGSVSSGAAVVLVDLSKLQFQTTNLVESDLTGLVVGAPATIRLKAHTETLTGAVAAVLAQSSGTQSGAALFTVLINVEPAELVLLPGMTGQTEITITQ